MDTQRGAWGWATCVTSEASLPMLPKIVLHTVGTERGARHVLPGRHGLHVWVPASYGSSSEKKTSSGSDDASSSANGSGVTGTRARAAEAGATVAAAITSALLSSPRVGQGDIGAAPESASPVAELAARVSPSAIAARGVAGDIGGRSTSDAMNVSPLSDLYKTRTRQGMC